MNTKNEIALAECQRAADLCDPPIDPIRIFRGDPRDNHWMISRLRAIIAKRLLGKGFSKQEIASLFRQTWNATDLSISRADRYADEARFQKINQSPTP